MSRQFSVLIPDGGGYDALKVMRCLGQASEVTTHVLTGFHLPLARFSRYCGRYHLKKIKGLDEQSFVEVVKTLAEHFGIDMVLPSTPFCLELISRNRASISEVTAVPLLPNEEILQIALDKWSFYQFSQKQGFPVIPAILAIDKTKIIANPAELESIEYPALLKPVTGMGGKGIIKIDSPSDLYRVSEKQETLKPGEKYILQSYIPGRDLCLGVCCKHGKIVASALQKSLFLPDNFFGPQKAMEFVHDDKVIELGTRLVSAMTWEGVAFIDFRVDERDDTLKLIEVNPRFGRGLFGSLQAGINFPLIWCLLSLSLEYTGQREAAGRYVYPSFFMSMLKSRLLGRPIPVKASVRETGLKLLLSDPVPDIVSAILKLKNLGLIYRRIKSGVNHSN